MASDVTIVVVFLLIFILLEGILTAKDGRHLVTRPIYHEATLYFELVEPEDIAYTFKIRPAKDFGMPLNRTLYHAKLIPADPFHGCSPLANRLYIQDNIALIERGGCSFLSKVINAESAGAVATIITDNDYTNDQAMIDMVRDETDRITAMPSYFLTGKDGFMIRQTLNQLHQTYALINIPINITGLSSKVLNQPPWTLW